MLEDQIATESKKRTKRKHAKIPLPDLLKEATPQEGVHWLSPHHCFEINWDLFVPFYHKRTNSTAKQQNIQNRFTRPKNGFCRDSTRTPSVGYDAVYNFSAKISSKSPTLPYIIPKDGNLLSLFEGQKEVSLMRVAQKLTETSNSPSDMNNMMDLLFYEVVEKKPNIVISEGEFDCFLNRFGPLEDIVYKMRDFINSGANDWYHGNISRETSETILKEHLKTNPSAFLIRAKSTPGNPVAFVISFGFSTPPSPPEIFHTQIFSIKNKLITVIQIDNQQREVLLSSVIEILDFLHPKPQVAVPSAHFKFQVEIRTYKPIGIENYNIPDEPI